MWTAIKIGGTILSALWTIAFNVITLAGVGTLFGYIIDWRWFTLGGFIAFLGFIGWWLGGLYRRIHELEANKPSIIVTHKVLNRRAILEVHNNGCTADFEAKARVIEGIPNMEPELYTMCWGVKGDHAIIPEGGTGIILVAIYSIVIQPTTYGIDMYRSGTQRFGIVPDGNIIIEVSINPTPPLKEPFEKRKYKLYLLEPANLRIEPANS